MRIEACRACGGTELHEFLDLGATPLADALVRPEDLRADEARFPLALTFCPESALVQITEDVPADRLFVDNYLYFSSFSDHLLRHGRDHALGLIETRQLGSSSLVVEIASNDGYLLKNFVEAGVPVLGIDPAPEQSAAARAAGVPTISRFFGRDLAEELLESYGRADVIIANNVFAHIPDINDFTAGMRLLLRDDGVIRIENPSVRELIERCAFDTVYHEHFYYHSCTSVSRQMQRHGLHLNHVEEFPDLHGGTLRWHISHRPGTSEALARHLDEEETLGLHQPDYYAAFAGRVRSVQQDLRAMIESLRSEGHTIAAYGAAAKGATMLNSVGIGRDLIPWVVDRNIHKHGLHMPGTHQLVRPVEALLDDAPDYVLLLAWNFASEIIEQQAEYTARGGRFIVPVPTPEIL